VSGVVLRVVVCGVVLVVFCVCDLFPFDTSVLTPTLPIHTSVFLPFTGGAPAARAAAAAAAAPVRSRSLSFSNYYQDVRF